MQDIYNKWANRFNLYLSESKSDLKSEDIQQWPVASYPYTSFCCHDSVKAFHPDSNDESLNS